MSIFEPTMISGSINGGAYGKRTEEISTKNNFSYATNQQCEFEWNSGEGSYLSPSESYLVVRYVIGNASGALNMDDATLSLAFDSPASLWQSGKFYLNNRVVSESNEIPQVDSYKKRVSHGNAYRNSVGQQQCLESNQADRMTTAQNSQTQDVVWRPTAISIFENSNLLPPNSHMRLTLQKHSSGVLAAVLNRAADKTKDTDYSLSISSVKLYATFYDGPSVPANSTYQYELDPVTVVRTSIAGSTSLNKQFNIPVSTYKLACCFQASEVGSAARNGPTHFMCTSESTANRTLNTLRTFSCQLGSQSYPFGGSYDVNYTESDPGTDTWSRPYIDYLIATNQDMSASSETKFQYCEQLGPILCFPIVSQGSSATGSLGVKATFSADPQNQDILVLAQHKQFLHIEYNDLGGVQDTFLSDQ